MEKPITSLYLFPALTVAAMAANGVTYDETKPAKFWLRPMATGESDTDDYVYRYVDMKSTQMHTHVMSVKDAATPNVPSTGASPLGEVPFPVRDLLPGESIRLAGLAAFGVAPVVVTADPPAPVAGADVLAEILADVKAIRAKLEA